MTKLSSKTSDYAEFLNSIKSRIRSARISVARQVNHGLIGLYWSIRHDIVEIQEALGWGKSVVEKLAKDLQKEFPKTTGYSPDNLWRMRQFYREYSNPKILEQLVPEIGTRSRPCV